MVWFFVAYVVRFCVNLLIEPQLNPLKHIPWVSVSHKIMLPIWGQMHLPELLGHYMNPFLAWLLAGVIVTGTPGIFGFLIWELMENWRLFAANRPKNLRAVRIGSHGETMLRLLRPSFHSGTIPKRFAKLRRAERKTLGGGDPGAARKYRVALHHVEIDLQRYVEREFIAWFAASRDWTGPLPQVRDVRLATNEAAIEVEMPQPEEEPRTMTFRLSNGSLQLELCGQLRLDRWPPAARKVYLLSFTNVLKTAGVVVFRRREEHGASREAADGQEVDQMVVTWADWVAAWEGGGKSLDAVPWRGLSGCD